MRPESQSWWKLFWYISIVLEFLCRKCGSSTEYVAKGDMDMTKSLFMNLSSRSRHWKRMTFQVLCHMWCCSNTTTGTLTERYCDIWGTWMFVRARDWARWLPGVPSRRSDWIICIYLRMGLPVLGFPWSASSVIGLPGAGFLFAINIYGNYQFEAAFHSKRILLKNGFVVLGFPWSALSVIGLPGTAFPEKLFERAVKKKYLASSFPASSSADKKKASEQTVLEIQGHAELGTKVFLSEEKHKSGQFYKRFLAGEGEHRAS